MMPCAPKYDTTPRPRTRWVYDWDTLASPTIQTLEFMKVAPPPSDACLTDIILSTGCSIVEAHARWAREWADAMQDAACAVAKPRE